MMGDLHLLPGTTFSSIRHRGEYKPAKMASLTMRELERWLNLQIVEIYHQRVHRSIGEPPIKAWEKALASGHVTIRHPFGVVTPNKDAIGALTIIPLSRPQRVQGRRSMRCPCTLYSYPVYGYVTTGLTTSGLVLLTVAPVPLMT
jgi:hypothetical protein